MDQFILRSSRIYWRIWLQLLPGIKQMTWRMEREVRLDYLFILSYILKSTVTKVVYIRANIVND